MTFRLLLDEMTAASLADYCRKLGHDVERVVNVGALGPGTDDEVLISYARREARLLVTHDDDFLADQGALDRIGVLFVPDDRAEPFTVANVIDTVDEYVASDQLVATRDRSISPPTGFSRPIPPDLSRSPVSPRQ